VGVCQRLREDSNVIERLRELERGLVSSMEGSVEGVTPVVAEGTGFSGVDPN
jgi:hypothetical protein